MTIRRRDFTTALLVAGATAPKLFAAPPPSLSIDATLKAGLDRRKIPSCTAMVATADRITYTGAFGKRDAAATSSLSPDAIFFIASMTKAITTAAAMQLIERGKLSLDDPAAKYIPDLGTVKIFTGFDSAGKPMLKPPTKQVTLRNLMTHTSGFCYDTWDKLMFEYTSKVGGAAPGTVAPLTPLMFEPGFRWQYGTGMDWTGRLVEVASGLSLEDYFQQNLLGPLGMKDTSFILKPEKFDRMVANHNRQPDGSLKEVPRVQPQPPKAYNGGGGLSSTTADYVKFMQMILKRGAGPGKERVLSEKSVAMMSANQTGDIPAGKMRTFRPTVSSDVDFHPGETDRYTFGFLMNPKAYPGGRSAGSLAWAGIDNTYYWIDPSRGICAVIMMQFLPFADKEAVSLLGEFERAVYAA
jgi:CubicO group peptidase (beta-lactamase class C family)